MDYQPYTLLGSGALAAVERRVADAAASWAREWFAAAAELSVRCVAAPGAGGDGVQTAPRLYAGADAGQWLALGHRAGLAQRLGAALTGNAAGGIQARRSPLLDELVQRALDGLVAQLCPWCAGAAPASAGGAAALPGQPWRAGSGAALAVIDLDGERIELLLGPGEVARLRGPAAAAPARPLAPLADALAGKPLSLSVMAGSAQVEVGLLKTIAVGDVIKLDTRIDQPLALVNEEGARLCGAFLGTSGGRKAVQLTK